MHFVDWTLIQRGLLRRGVEFFNGEEFLCQLTEKLLCKQTEQPKRAQICSKSLEFFPRNPPDVRPERLELLFDGFVSPVDMIDAQYFGFPFGHEPGKNQ